MEIHHKFKLNGNSFSNQKLKEVAYSLIKEGEPFESVIGDFLLDWLDTSKSVTVFTSGSTGKPKKIQLQKMQMVNSALATGNFFNLKAEESALLCLPSSFIAGKMMLVRAMVLGLELDYVQPNSIPLKAINRKYNFVAMIPLQAQNSIEKLHLIDKLIVGGAPISGELESKLEEAETSIYETYGMTETITHIAIKKIGAPYFKTLSEVSIEKDTRDCLVIDAPKISNTKVVTNDIVELVSKEEFQWLGRYDTIINSGGVKLIPEQIEKKLNPIIENRFFVAGIPDEILSEKLVLIVEGVKEVGLLEKIIQSETLTKHEIPKAIIFIPEFPETDNGKVLRTETLRAFLDS